VATFKNRKPRIVICDLRNSIENFARRLRFNFRAEIEQDAAQFKRRAVGLVRRNLPPQRRRPCSHPVTRALLLRARKTPWPRVYSACLPSSADRRERLNLRVAVRMQRMRLSRSYAKKKIHNYKRSRVSRPGAAELTVFLALPSTVLAY
jgi:hypothetical protein